MDGPLELYNLKTDGSEQQDVAKDNRDRVAQAEKLLKVARVENENFPWKQGAGKARGKNNKKAVQ